MKFLSATVVALLCISFLTSYVNGNVVVKKCNHVDPLPLEFRLNNCNDYRCVGYAYENTTVEVDFKALYPSQDLKLDLQISIPGWYESVLSYDDLCNDIQNESCPLKTNKKYTLSRNIVLPAAGISYTFDVNARLMDDKDRVHTCFGFVLAVKRKQSVM